VLEFKNMINFEVTAAIFDVDDTLLDNQGDLPGKGLHERSRFNAVREVGRRHNIAALKKWTPEDNRRAFRDAPSHTIISAVWNTLLMCDLRHSPNPDPNDPLLTEIIAVRMELHRDVLLREGEAYPGAVEFVAALASSGLQDKLAIATAGYREEIKIFLGKSGLDQYFPDAHIISLEDVTHAKPDPEAFNLAYATLGLPDSDRRHTCAFEDNPRGIASAHAAGLYVCALTNIYSQSELRSLKQPPDMIANTFNELIEEFNLTDKK
jgi:HAD superfamily hydrolase (TIGR01509 family)